MCFELTWVEKGGVRRWGAQPRKSGGSKGGGSKGGGPEILRFFFPVRSQFSFFSSLSGGLLVKFWWCLKRRSPEMCTFGVLGLSCETRTKLSHPKGLAKLGWPKSDWPKSDWPKAMTDASHERHPSSAGDAFTETRTAMIVPPFRFFFCSFFFHFHLDICQVGFLAWPKSLA